MMEIITAYLLIILAALLNAVMDRTENIVAFNRSIFSHLDQKFWCKEISWQYATKIIGWKADAWHIAKSGMICLLIAIIFFHVPWWHYFILGVTWNVSFTFFYHKLLHR